VNGYRLDSQDQIPSRDRDYFHHHIQINSGTHSTSYPTDTRGCISRGKAVGA